MKYNILLILILLILTNCRQTANKEGKIFYVETQNFSAVLQTCFSHSLFNKWTDISDLKLNDHSKPFTGKDISDKHIFLDSEYLTEAKVPANFEKIRITLKSDSVYSIERFKFETNGQWKRVANLGNFQTNERANTSGSLDADGLCKQIIKTILIASYK